MEFKDLLKNRRSEIGITLEEIGKIVGVSKATVQRWESGEIKNIRRDKIAKLAQALQTTPAYLMGWEDDPEPENLEKYGLRPVETKKFPMLGKIACGQPIYCETDYETFIEASSDIKADFCLTAQGDSMINARIFDGDIVFIRKQSDVDNGEIAAIVIGDEVTLKRVYKYPHFLELRAENPTYPPLHYEDYDLENIRILGKAVAFQSYLR